MDKETKNDFSKLFTSFLEEYRRSLSEMYPCELNGSATLPEANLTTSFFVASKQKSVYENPITWNEYSVKGQRVEPNKKDGDGGNMDGFLLDSRGKRIILIESKRMVYKKRKQVLESATGSLASDLAREINVANSDVFPKRVWDTSSQKPFEPLGSKYQEYRTFGLALVSIWIDIPGMTTGRLQNLFAEYLKRHFLDEGLLEALKRKNLPLIKTEDAFCRVADLSGLYPKLQGKEWNLFLLMFAWEIDRPGFDYNIDYSPLPEIAYQPVGSTESNEIKEWVNGYVRQNSGVYEKGRNAEKDYVYLYPKQLVQKGLLSNKNYLNDAIWVCVYAKEYKGHVFLYAGFKNGSRPFSVPNGFSEYSYKKWDRFKPIQCSLGSYGELSTPAGREKLAENLKNAMDSLVATVMA